MTLPETIAHLRGLYEKATKGPWGSRVWEDPQWTVTCKPTANQFCVAVTSQANDRANAELIAAMHNALPSLLAEIERLQKALRMYGDHLPIDKNDQPYDPANADHLNRATEFFGCRDVYVTCHCGFDAPWRTNELV